MENYNEHIVNEFADIFELSYDNASEMWDKNLFYIYRDDFYQNHRAFLSHGQESLDDFALCMEREPFVDSSILKRLACATAKYYCDEFGSRYPSWACQFDGENNDCLVPIFPSAENIGEMISATPDVFLELGLIYPEKNMRVL